MKTRFKLIAAFAAAFCFTLAAFAAEASPTGIWKWTVQGRGGQGFEQTLKLSWREGKLSGIMVGSHRGQYSIPDTQISDASFENGTVKFAVVREFNGNKFTTHYEGQLEGDSIKGTSETSGLPNREPMKRDWEAKRAR